MATFVVDGANWRNTFKDIHKINPKIDDFKDLIKDCEDFFDVENEMIFSTYIDTKSEKNYKRLIDDIKKLGFTIEECNAYNNKQKYGDAVIATVLMELFINPEVKIIVLVTGDGDFRRTLESNIKYRGIIKRKKIYLVSYNRSININLIQYVDKYMELKEDNMDDNKDEEDD